MNKSRMSPSIPSCSTNVRPATCSATREADTECRTVFSFVQLHDKLCLDENWVTEIWLDDLIKHGVLVFDSMEGRCFSQKQLDTARMAAALYRSLSISPSEIAVAFKLLDRISSLENRLTGFRRIVAWSAERDADGVFH